MVILLLHGCWLTPAEIDAKLAGGGDSGLVDSDDPDGIASIDELGPGDLVITEVMRNPSAVDDFEGEWIEVHNPGGAVDLDGLRLRDADTDGYTIVGRLVLPAGAYYVFGSSTDGGENGGAAVDHAWQGFALGNGADEAWLAFGDETFDEVAWTETWAGWEAASMSLDAGLDAEDNDVREAWCDAVDVYGDGDRGTPGEANPPCP